MKKFISVLAVLLVVGCLFSGCSKNKNNDKADFIDVQWTRSTEADTEFLRFSQDGSFSYYCGCGNPVDDSDLCEGYSYNEKNKTITLDFADSKTKINVKEATADRLVLDFGGEERIFEREKEDSEKVGTDTLNYQGKTYSLLEYNSDIFYYDLAKGVDNYEEDTIIPLKNDKWDFIYYNGDLFVLSESLKEATSYYANDLNFYWSGWIDDEEKDFLSF